MKPITTPELASTNRSVLSQLLQLPVLVAALGYLVDMYDLFLFSVVRVPSLKGLGIDGDRLLSDGLLLLNAQMAGLLIGGIFWGILGDKRGRLSVLFGSILLYSLANIANGFVTSLDQYVLLRFVAGLGLAGELGAGITLVTEILPKEDSRLWHHACRHNGRIWVLFWLISWPTCSTGVSPISLGGDWGFCC